MKFRNTIGLILVFILAVTCSRDFEIIPAVETGDVEGLGAKSASVKAEIIDIGDGIVEHGHCYGTSPEPTTNEKKSTKGRAEKVKEYSSELVDLEPGTHYYVRAYVISGENTYYGVDKQFTTHDGIVTFGHAMVNSKTRSFQLFVRFRFQKMGETRLFLGEFAGEKR